MKKRGERILGPYKQHNGWRVIEIDDTGKRDSTVFPTESKAERYIEYMRADLERLEHTTATAWEEYRRHLVKKGNKAEAITVVEWAILLFFPDPVQLSMLSGKRCQALYDAIQERPSKATGQKLAADTHRGALARAKTFLAWCTEQDYIKANPFAAVKGIGKLRRRGKSLGKRGHKLRIDQTRLWYAKALELADKGDAGAVAGLVALLLGMRPIEIASIKVGDLDSDRQAADVLDIPDSKTEDGKRKLDIPDELRPHLMSLAEGRADDRPLFELSEGVAHDPEWIRKQVGRICGLVKVPVVTAYFMRGQLATIAAERGVAGRLIAATLGHTPDAAITRAAYMEPGSEANGINRNGLVVLNGGAK